MLGSLAVCGMQGLGGHVCGDAGVWALVGMCGIKVPVCPVIGMADLLLRTNLFGTLIKNLCAQKKEETANTRDRFTAAKDIVALMEK